MSTTIVHFKKLGPRTAGCGVEPDVAFDDWSRVTCAQCLAKGERVRGKMPEPAPAPGQVWARISDNVKTTISSVDGPGIPRRSILHKPVRWTRTEYGPFLRKYEYIRG